MPDRIICRATFNFVTCGGYEITAVLQQLDNSGVCTMEGMATLTVNGIEWRHVRDTDDRGEPAGAQWYRDGKLVSVPHDSALPKSIKQAMRNATRAMVSMVYQ